MPDFLGTASPRVALVRKAPFGNAIWETPVPVWLETNKFFLNGNARYWRTCVGISIQSGKDSPSAHIGHLADVCCLYKILVNDVSKMPGRIRKKSHILPKLLLTLFLTIFTIPHRRRNQKCLPAQWCPTKLGKKNKHKAHLCSLASTPGSRVSHTSVGWLPFVAGGFDHVFRSVDAGLDGRQ
jgi:hypothetical protein